MPYVDLAGLSRYASRQKDRLERDCALLRDMQWLRTEKAGAVSLWPAGGTPLKPVVDFLFAETPPASGDKSPSNPSTITGVSSVKVTRCGKNLIPVSTAESITSNGVTFTVNADGSIHVSGMASDTTYFIIINNVYIPAGTYVLSGCPSDGAIDKFSLRFESNDGGNPLSDTGESRAVVLSSSQLSRVRIRVQSGASVNATFKPQLELGTDATAFDPYAGTDYTLPLGGTYYGGTLDVASGVMTVTHRSEQLTSVRSLQSVNTNTVCFRLNTTASFVPENPTVQLTTASNRFTYSSAIGDFEYFRVVGAFGGSSKLIEVSINKTRLDVSMATDPSNPTGGEWETAFASWLESNPTFFVGKLFTPFTVTLTPTEILSLTQTDKYTPRLNTVYTDAQAVQAGYVKSPIRDEYELQQAVIAQGGNV